MIQCISAQVILLVVKLDLWAVAPHIEVNETLHLSTAALNLFVCIAQFFYKQCEEFR